MVFYEKYGFQIKLLEREHGTEIFRLLSSTFLDKSRNTEMYSKDRRVLKKQIIFALNEDYYNSVGIFKNDELVGISFNSFVEPEMVPWLGYFYIKKSNRKRMASAVLMNYLMNHLYKGYRIQIGSGDMSDYKNRVTQLETLIGHSVINDSLGPRLAKICGEEQ